MVKMEVRSSTSMGSWYLSADRRRSRIIAARSGPLKPISGSEWRNAQVGFDEYPHHSMQQLAP